MNGKKRLATIIILLLSLLAIGGIYDAYQAANYRFEISSSVPVAKADGHTPVVLKVRVLDSAGKPRRGDRIYGLTTFGVFESVRVLTDSDGIAEFIYYPVQSSAINKAQDDTLRFYDETVSKVIQIPPKTAYLLKVEDSGEERKERLNSDAFF